MSDLVGKSAGWLIFPLIGVMVLSTVLRYGFNRSPVWSYDLPWMIQAVYFLLGGAYCHLHNGHVKVDMLSERLAPQAKLILEIGTYLIFFLPLFYVLIVGGIPYACKSLIHHEVSPYSSLGAPVGPIKAIMVIGFILLAFEGISKFVRDIYSLRHLSSDTRKED